MKNALLTPISIFQILDVEISLKIEKTNKMNKRIPFDVYCQKQPYNWRRTHGLMYG